MLQHKHSSLPSRQCLVFDGEPFNFQTFMLAFKHGIESKTDNDDRIYYLYQQTRELGLGCFHMQLKQEYAEAKRLLKIHFENRM